MNILREKQRLLPMGNYMMDGGGGGGGGGSSTGTQTQISELPEWARSYAKNTLEKTAALTDQPYQTYNAPRIAGFSPLQQQSQQDAAGMQTNAGTGMGMGIAGAAALGGLNQDYDGMQMRSQNFGNRSAQQYMSPYVQQALAPQMQQIQRTGEQQKLGNAGQATQAGAFGGSRFGIQNAMTDFNTQQAQSQAYGTGMNNAYNNAQTQFNADQARNMQAQQANIGQQQFGANLGLQGLNTALQGAGQLGALGGQQFQQGMDINKLQNAYGGQQQALQQQGLSQAYQDFQNQQNYPYKQLGFMSDMIRGLPLGQVTSKSMYEPDPGLAQQIGSIGMGAYGLSKFMADGGLTSYADGGEVQGYAGDQGSVTSSGNIEEIVHELKSDQQLQQALKAAQARGDVDQLNAVQNEMGMRASLRKGIAGGVTNQMADRMAGGGVVAFAQGGSSATLAQLGTLADTDLTQTPEQQNAGISAAMPGIEQRYGPNAITPYMEDVKKERAGLSKMSGEGEGLAFLAASQALLRPGSKSRAVAGAMGAFGTEVIKMKKEQREADHQLRQSEITLATAEQARKDGLTGKAESLYDKSQTQKKEGLDRHIGVLEKKAAIEAGTENAKTQAAATLGKKTDLERLTDAQHAKLLESGEPNNATTRALASERAANLYGRMAGNTRADIAGTTAREKAADAVDMAKLQDPAWKEAKKNKDTESMRAREEELINQRMGKKPEGGGGGGPAPAKQSAVATGQPMYATNGKERIISTDGGQTWKPVGAQ